MLLFCPDNSPADFYRTVPGVHVHVVVQEAVFMSVTPPEVNLQRSET